jgi:hypothetical protein
MWWASVVNDARGISRASRAILLERICSYSLPDKTTDAEAQRLPSLVDDRTVFLVYTIILVSS